MITPFIISMRLSLHKDFEKIKINLDRYICKDGEPEKLPIFSLLGRPGNAKYIGEVEGNSLKLVKLSGEGLDGGYMKESKWFFGNILSINIFGKLSASNELKLYFYYDSLFCFFTGIFGIILFVKMASEGLTINFIGLIAMYFLILIMLGVNLIREKNCFINIIEK